MAPQVAAVAPAAADADCYINIRGCVVAAVAPAAGDADANTWGLVRTHDKLKDRHEHERRVRAVSLQMTTTTTRIVRLGDAERRTQTRVA